MPTTSAAAPFLISIVAPSVVAIVVWWRNAHRKNDAARLLIDPNTPRPQRDAAWGAMSEEFRYEHPWLHPALSPADSRDLATIAAEASVAGPGGRDGLGPANAALSEYCERGTAIASMLQWLREANICRPLPPARRRRLLPLRPAFRSPLRRRVLGGAVGR
jgi:hypothetical protein